MVVDRLLALDLIGAEAVCGWAFGIAIPATLSEQASASTAWEVGALSPTLHGACLVGGLLLCLGLGGTPIPATLSEQASASTAREAGGAY